MKVDQEFLKAVQRAGWKIKLVDSGRVLAGCPRAHCEMQTVLKPGSPIPDTCSPDPGMIEVEIRSYDDGRRTLRDRRQDLCMTMTQVEFCAGLTEGHLLKAEKDNPDRVMSVEGFIVWANTLGFEVVLRSGDLPPVTLRELANSQPQVETRKQRRAMYERRREEKERARLLSGKPRR